MHKNTCDSDDHSLKSDSVDLTNEQNQPLPPIKQLTKARNGSVSIDIGKNDSNYIDCLGKMSHQEILKWLEERNLGKLSKRVF